MYGFFKNLRFFEPFLMLFFIDKGINFIQIGTLYALREISINLLEIPTGVFADILGRRKTMIFSFLGYIISFILFYFSTTYSLLLLAMLVFGFGDAMRTGTHKAMIFDYLKIKGWNSQRVAYYGRTRSWSQIGSAISSLLAASIVIITGNYEIVFLISTLPYLGNLILIWSYPPVLDGPIKNNHEIKLAKNVKNYFSDLKISFSIRALWVTFLNLASYQGYFKAIKDYLQPIIVLAIAGSYLHGEASADFATTSIVGIIYFIIYIISSFTSRYASKMVDWLKTPERVINITLAFGLLVGVFAGGLITSENNKWAALIFILIFVVQNIRKPIGSSVIAENVKNEVLATGLSIQSQFDSLLAALCAILMGFLAENFGLGKALMILGVTLLLISQFLRIKPNKGNL